MAFLSFCHELQTKKKQREREREINLILTSVGENALELTQNKIRLQNFLSDLVLNTRSVPILA